MLIILLAIQIIVLLFFLGYGASSILLPKRLQQYIFWLAPWIGTILIVIFGVMFNLAKIPMAKSSYFLLIIAFAFLAWAIFNKKINLHLGRSDFWLTVLILISLIFNLYPLIKRAGFPTVISKSNLDPVTYSMVSDFLVNHTVFEGRDFVHYKPYLWAVRDLVHSGFRWGSPLILSFFAQILQLKSYQIFSVLINVYFVLSIPLVYILFSVLKPKLSLPISMVVPIIYAFNSTLLYMLYNGFFAQFIFSGIFILVFIFFCSYMLEPKKITGFNRFDFLLAVCLSSLTSIYSEGLVFIFLPFALFVFLDLMFKRRWLWLGIFLKVVLLTFIINPFNLGTTIRLIMLIFSSTSKAGVFIGWEKIPYAAPLEILGFYNLYYSRDLAVWLDIILGWPLVVIILLALLQAKNQLFLAANFLVFIFIYVMYRFVAPNYYLYHKAITYTVFLYIVLFVLGIDWLFSSLKNRVLQMVIIMIFLGLSFRSAYRTIYQLYWHPYVVDLSLVSLRSLNENRQMNKAFFTADVYLGEYDLWKRLWREYLLMDKDIITRQNYPSEKKNLQDVHLVLAEKKYLEREGKKIVYKNIVWENQYYQLGEIESMTVASDLLKY